MSQLIASPHYARTKANKFSKKNSSLDFFLQYKGINFFRIINLHRKIIAYAEKNNRTSIPSVRVFIYRYNTYIWAKTKKKRVNLKKSGQSVSRFTK